MIEIKISIEKTSKGFMSMYSSLSSVGSVAEEEAYEAREIMEFINAYLKHQVESSPDGFRISGSDEIVKNAMKAAKGKYH